MYESVDADVRHAPTEWRALESCANHTFECRAASKTAPPEEDTAEDIGKSAEEGLAAAEEPGRRPKTRASPQFDGTLRHNLAAVTPR